MSPVPPPPPAKAPRKPADRAKLLRAGLGVLVLALTVVALAVEENSQRGYEAWTTWAIFATVMAAVHLLPLVWKAEPRRVWDVVAIATGGLVFYWVAIVLPFIGNATSFAQTLAVAFALAHLWLLPGRR
jgi:cytochrome b561